MYFCYSSDLFDFLSLVSSKTSNNIVPLGKHYLLYVTIFRNVMWYKSKTECIYVFNISHSHVHAISLSITDDENEDFKYVQLK